MAIAQVVSGSAASSDTQNVTTGSLDTTGCDLLVVLISGTSGPIGSGTVSDSKGNTWNKLTAPAVGSGFNGGAVIWYAVNPTVGSGHTFTLSSGITGYPSIVAAGYSGSDTTSPFDVENGATLNASSGQPGSVTPSVNDELLVTGSSNGSFGAATVTSDSGFTDVVGRGVSGNGLGISYAYKVQTTAGAENPTWTTTAGSIGVAVIATFKAAAGGGGTTYHNLCLLGVGG